MKKTSPKFMSEDFKIMAKLFVALTILAFVIGLVYHSIAAYYGF